MIIHELLIRPDPTPLTDLDVANRVAHLANADIFVIAQATATSDPVPAGEYLEEHYHTGDIHTALADLAGALTGHADHYTYDLTPHLHAHASTLPAGLLDGQAPLTDFTDICGALRALTPHDLRGLLKQLPPIQTSGNDYGLPIP